MKLNFNNIFKTNAPPAPVEVKKNLSNYIAPVQLARLRHDVAMWRACAAEAEQPYYPHRVKMQRMYLDTRLNGHVYAAWERRKEMTLLRDFHIVDAKGALDVERTRYFTDAAWFGRFMSFALDALAYGYSLIELGDCVGDDFPDITHTRRWNVRPDGLSTGGADPLGAVLTPYIYGIDGLHFQQAPYDLFNIYVPTPTDTGVSCCGYGLLYPAAMYEIILRNCSGWHADFTELYASPYRIGKTNKTDENERAQLENALQSLGNSNYAVLDPTDSIEFLETKLSGTGWQSYESLESYCIRLISQIILGHADALNSIPGRLGAAQDGELGPIASALRDKQSRDARFILPVINNELFPRLRKIGLGKFIPEGYRGVFANDSEEMEARAEENKRLTEEAAFVGAFKLAGYDVPVEWLRDRTGIPVSQIPFSSATSVSEPAGAPAEASN